MATGWQVARHVVNIGVLPPIRLGAKSVLHTIRCYCLLLLIINCQLAQAQTPAHEKQGAATGAELPKITGTARLCVRSDATGGDGKTWDAAFPSIQAAIDAAAQAGGGEVWVAKGDYRPTEGHDREATFQLRSGVAVYGGFAGTEIRRDDRDWQRNVTVLSGRLGREGAPSGNSYHVVTGADNALLDGFLIRDGYAMDAGGPHGADSPAGGSPPGSFSDGPPQQRRGPPGRGQIHTSPEAILSGSKRGFGAGMLNFQCAPTIRNCTFCDNYAGKGGAVYNMVSHSFPPRRDKTLPAPLFIDCRFLNNHARGRGGAVANDLGTSPAFRGCTFLRNVCDDKGGSLYNDFGCSPTLINCLLAENRAASAAAIGNDGGSSPRIIHCTFSGNLATEEGAALYQGTGPANNPIVVGCILWNDHCENGPAEIFNWHDNDPQVTGCCIQGGYAGGQNFDKDPSFVDPAHGDYRLRADSPSRDIGFTAAVSTVLPAMVGPALPARPPRRRAAETKPGKDFARASARVLFVRAANTAGPWDGRSWSTAFATLADALAATGGGRREIWVAAGTYKPTGGTDRTASFVLQEGLELYGGFMGGESSRSQRDWNRNATILSGNIGPANRGGDNSFHVVIGADESVLDGFVVRDGNADGRTYDGKGGGMINYRRAAQAGPMGEAVGYSPTVRNCLFTDNRAREGGAVYDYDRGQPQFVNCRFVNNSADYGGAIVDRVGVKSVFVKCEFASNSARWRAGALYLDYGARPQVTDCRFQGNHSDCHGGAVATVSRASQLESTIPVLQRCSFQDNTARQRGGAISNSDQSRLGLEDCSFSGNRAGAGGGALANIYRARAVLINCRFSGNRSDLGEADIATDSSSTISHDRSDWPDQTSPSPPTGLGPPR